MRIFHIFVYNDGFPGQGPVRANWVCSVIWILFLCANDHICLEAARAPDWKQQCPQQEQVSKEEGDGQVEMHSDSERVRRITPPPEALSSYQISSVSPILAYLHEFAPGVEWHNLFHPLKAVLTFFRWSLSRAHLRNSCSLFCSYSL